MTSAPLLAAVVALGAPAAAHAAPAGTVDFRVIKATHTSTATKADAHYRGTSTASWSLARPSAFHLSWMAGGLFSGTGRIAVRGRYAIDATTDVPGHCAWEAATGDALHPIVAPAPFTLTAVPDARRPGRALVGFVAVQATLRNAYLGTECSTGADEPDGPDMQSVDLAPARLRAKTITLRFAGRRTGTDGTSYTYRTEIVLRRAGR